MGWIPYPPGEGGGSSFRGGTYLDISQGEGKGQLIQRRYTYLEHQTCYQYETHTKHALILTKKGFCTHSSARVMSKTLHLFSRYFAEFLPWFKPPCCSSLVKPLLTSYYMTFLSPLCSGLDLDSKVNPMRAIT